MMIEWTLRTGSSGTAHSLLLTYDNGNMDSIPFRKEGFTLERTDDKGYVLDCMKETILSSVTGIEREYHDLWIHDTMMVVASNLNDPRNEAFALMHDGEKVGMLWLGRSNDQFTCEPIGYVLGIFVKDGYRGKGLGKEMMSSAEGWCKENGLLSLSLNVSVANPVARSLYDGCGFTEQSIVMRKELRR